MHQEVCQSVWMVIPYGREIHISRHHTPLQPTRIVTGNYRGSTALLHCTALYCTLHVQLCSSVQRSTVYILYNIPLSYVHGIMAPICEYGACFKKHFSDMHTLSKLQCVVNRHVFPGEARRPTRRAGLRPVAARGSRVGRPARFSIFRFTGFAARIRRHDTKKEKQS